MNSPAFRFSWIDKSLRRTLSCNSLPRDAGLLEISKHTFQWDFDAMLRFESQFEFGEIDAPLELIEGYEDFEDFGSYA